MPLFSSSTSTHHQICKEACVLNNTAVAMMQRGEIENALKTLKDSIAHAELLIHQGGPLHTNPTEQQSSPFGAGVPPGSSSTQPAIIAGQKRIRMASARLSQTYSSSSQHHHHDSSFDIQVVESNDCGAMYTAAFSSSSSSQDPHIKSGVTAIFIRDLDLHSSSFDRETGIILYNFALASFLLGAAYEARCTPPSQFLVLAKHQQQAPQRSDKVFKCRDVAYRSLLMAHSTFGRIAATAQQEQQAIPGSNNNTMTQHHTMLEHMTLVCLQVMTLSVIQQVLESQQDWYHALQARHAIQALQASTEPTIMSHLFGSMAPHITAAAA